MALSDPILREIIETVAQKSGSYVYEQMYYSSLDDENVFTKEDSIEVANAVSEVIIKILKKKFK